MVYAVDSKSTVGDHMGVRVPPSAPFFYSPIFLCYNFNNAPASAPATTKSAG